MAVAVSLAGPAAAEGLYDAFRSAYDTNPNIGSQRAAVKVSAKDQLLSATGFMPAVTANADYGYRDRRGHEIAQPNTSVITHPRGYGVTLNQNLFNGLKTVNSVAREGASLAAARDALRNVEQKILVDVATAYADVMRDTAILALRRSDMDVLATRADQTRLQFQIGDLTRTDVDQSEAALARSRADLAVAEANLQGSKAVFRAVVGREAGHLEPAAFPERLVPKTLSLALQISQDQHPAIRSAIQKVRAAELNVAVEKAGWAPSVDLQATAEKRWSPETYSPKTELNNYAVLGKVSFPIFDRGVTLVSVQRANELKSQQELQLDAQRAEIQANVIQAWGQVVAARSVMVSAEAQIAASQRALVGVQLEASAGARTTLDILNAQRSLVDARVYRETAHRDRLVAGYKLLAALGRLSLADLQPGDTRGRVLATPRLPAAEPFIRSLPDRMEPGSPPPEAGRGPAGNGMAELPEEARPSRAPAITAAMLALTRAEDDRFAFASGRFSRVKLASLFSIGLTSLLERAVFGPIAPEPIVFENVKLRGSIDVAEH